MEIVICRDFSETPNARYRAEHVEKILLHLQEIVTSEKFYIIPDDGQVDAIQKDL